jgi:hypothetical protein
MRARNAIALAAATTALLVGPAPAAGAGLPFRLPSWAPPQLRALLAPRPGPSHRRNPFVTSVRLPAQNGYQIALLGSDNRVVLEIGRKHSDAIAVYVAPGVVTRRRVQADFGAFGRIDMRFRPAGRGAGAGGHPECSFHQIRVSRRGVFVGSLSFDGENGYVSVRAHRARGEVVSSGDRCAGHGPLSRARRTAARAHKPRDPGPQPRFFFAGWRHAVDSAEFAAFELFGTPLFLAASEHSEGRLAVVRLAFVIGHDPRAFTLDDAVTRATLSPPAPFHGTGTYTAAPDGTRTWEGSLSINFPGAPRFALTGPPFEPEVDAGFSSSALGRLLRR